MNRVALSFVNVMVNSSESPLLRPYDVTSFSCLLPNLLWASVLRESPCLISTGSYQPGRWPFGAGVLWKLLQAPILPHSVWSSMPVRLMLRRSAITSKMLHSILEAQSYSFLRLKSALIPGHISNLTVLLGSSLHVLTGPKDLPKALIAEASWITPSSALISPFCVVI